MNKNKIQLGIFSLFMILLSDSYSLAYDNTVTHRDITKKSVISSNLLEYLKQNLGLVSGYDEKINGKKIMEWLQEGSYLEDVPNCRASNHFHNPLLSWDQSYVTDLRVLPETAWCYLGWIPPYSNVTWATGYKAPAPNGEKIAPSQSIAVGPNLWDEARDYYYKALTLKQKMDRDIFLTWSLTAVGNTMHLIQDMAVPAHVRNDYTSHLIGGAINVKQPYEYYVQNNSQLVTGATPTFPSFDDIKLTDFWDTDQYNGSNPSTFTTIGLAEFTNANYFSDYTIPHNGTTTEHRFPYPNLSSSNISGPNYQFCPTNIPSGEVAYYVSRKACSEADYFAAVSLLDSENYSDGVSRPFVWLDDNVHKTYAKELLPRAIGYSAGLLDYFFRGKLGITQVSGGIKVKNLGTETMSTYIDQTAQTTIGTITVYYDNTLGTRTFLAKYDLTTPIEPGAETDIISFAPPTSNLSPKRYIVVFRGKLGNEEGAVIGKVGIPQHVYYVATTSGWDKIYKIDADWTNQSLVYDNPDGDYIGKIALSPDGNTLAFASSPDGLVVNATIKTLNLADTALTPTFLTSGNWPSWSPDGTKIAFERDTSQDPYSVDIKIFTIDVATRAEIQLYDDPASNYSGSPAWSPTENTIAYAKLVGLETNCATPYVISLMDTVGYPIGPLTCPPEGQYMSVGDFDPAWSPDGQEIAFTRRRYVGRSSQLNKVTVATKAITKLTDSPDVGYDEYTPAWSFDEMSLAIGSRRDGDYDVWLVDPYGGGYLQNITNSNPDIDGYPAFGK